MSDLRPAWWDSDAAARYFWEEGSACRLLTPAERMVARVSGLESAARSAEDAAQEFDLRIEHATQRFEAFITVELGWRRIVAVLGITATGLAVLGLGLLMSSVVVMLLSVPFAILLVVLLRPRKHPALVRLQKRHCLDCGYDLSGSVLAASSGGKGFGPAACSECGVAWPLVPPKL